MSDFEPANPYRTAPAAFSADPLSIPYSGQSRMRLVVVDGLANARVHIDPAATALIRVVDFDCGPVLQLRIDGDTVRLVWTMSLGDKLRMMFDGARSAPEIVLHPAVAWSLAIRGGLSEARLDLAAGRVAGIEIAGGCSDVDIELPAISDATTIRIAGGASQVHLRRPAGIGVSVAIAGGASALQLDDQLFGAIGGRTVLHGRGGGAGQPHYDVTVQGGASGLAVL